MENLNPLSRKGLAPSSKGDAVVEQMAAALRARGYSVDVNVGQSRFRCDLAVRGNADSLYQLGILVDTEGHYANPNLLERYLMQPSILRAFGWRFTLVLTKDWYHTPDDVLNRIEKLLQGQELMEEPRPQDEEPEAAVADASDGVTPKTTALPPPGSSLPKAEKESEKGVEPPPVASSHSASTSVRHFEFISGPSKKFWEISLVGTSFTVHFGRIGTAGQSQTKTFADEASARREVEHLIAEKERKGYIEKN